jgi:hypothetical protein
MLWIERGLGPRNPWGRFGRGAVPPSEYNDQVLLVREG